MAEAENNSESTQEVSCRPVLFTDPKSLRQYPNIFRSTLVGLVGSAHRTGLAGSTHSDLYTVLCPSVEPLVYPSVPFFWLHRPSRDAFLETLSRFKPTILHGIWPQHGRLLRMLSQALQVPHVLSFFALPGKIGRLLSPLSSVDGYIAATEPIREALGVYVGSGSDRIVTVPPGCYVEKDVSCFSEGQHRPSMLLIHPLRRMEDFEPLLQAVRHLLLDGFEFFLGILGSGRAEPALRSRIRALGLTSMLTLVPVPHSFRDVLCGADMYVRLASTGRYDPVLVEAMAVGLAAASCPDPVNPLLEDGRTAVLFEPNDELSIYNALKKLLSRPEWARQLAAAAQEHIRQNHQVSRMIDLLLEQYINVQSRYQRDNQVRT